VAKKFESRDAISTVKFVFAIWKVDLFAKKLVVTVREACRLSHSKLSGPVSMGAVQRSVSGGGVGEGRREVGLKITNRGCQKMMLIIYSKKACNPCGNLFLLRAMIT
jgi:hypothetical protein